jgi:hypothetical protein
MDHGSQKEKNRPEGGKEKEYAKTREKRKKKGKMGAAIWHHLGIWLHAYLVEFLGGIKEESSSSSSSLEDKDGGLAGVGMGGEEWLEALFSWVDRGEFRAVSCCGKGFLRKVEGGELGLIAGEGAGAGPDWRDAMVREYLNKSHRSTEYPADSHWFARVEQWHAPMKTKEEKDGLGGWKRGASDNRGEKGKGRWFRKSLNKKWNKKRE